MYAVVRSHKVKICIDSLNGGYCNCYHVYTQDVDVKLCNNLLDALHDYYDDEHVYSTKIKELLDEEKCIVEGTITHHSIRLPHSESEAIQIVQIINGKLHFATNYIKYDKGDDMFN